MAEPAPGYLIRDAEVRGHGRSDLRIAAGRIAAIGALDPLPSEHVIEACSGALLPGLHDHHIHLAALAARASSVWAGPPQVNHAPELAAALSSPGEGWLRAIGYHESVMGLPDARELDALVVHRPSRLQHRSGRMWLLNSLALDLLLQDAAPPPGLERQNGRYTGRLFDEDQWLRQTLSSQPPDFSAVSTMLAACGVTGLTDMSPRNDPAMAAHFAAQCQAGSLPQGLWLAGALSLADAPPLGWHLGPAKLHLHEADMPDWDESLHFVTRAHATGRGVAVHCTTEVELVYTLALFEEAGSIYGDRIEHASIAAPHLIARMAALGLAVCVQPHFIAERGDRYRLEVEAEHRGDLYRLASLQAAGLTMAGGSDAPFGDADPWAAMRAAVSRQTHDGHVLGAEEALTPETALALFLADPADLGRERRIAVGDVADFCLLDRPWTEARKTLLADHVRVTFSAGRIVHQRIDQPPVERLSR